MGEPTVRRTCSDKSAEIVIRHSRPHGHELHPEEEVEIRLLLWEYERDGNITIDNFIRREPRLSLRMASGVLPVRVQQRIIEYIIKRRR